MNFKISKETLQNILNYLATKPFNEVTQLINIIQQEINNQPKEEVCTADIPTAEQVSPEQSVQ